MSMRDSIIIVRGAGDLATGVIYPLARCGFRVLATEIAQPTAIRRSVAFSEAIYEKTAEVEGVTARKIEDLSGAEGCWERGEVPVLCDPAADCVRTLQPEIFVDAAIAKRNLGTSIDMAPLVIALGPGFTAGADADAVIETQRGHNLGRIITEGTAAANTGIPGIVGGYGRERVIHSGNAGVFRAVCRIGDTVHKGQILAYVDDQPVPASLDGVLRGLLRSGLTVPAGFKIADIDPRIEEKNNCFTISDKARALGGSVLTVICHYLMKEGKA